MWRFAMSTLVVAALFCAAPVKTQAASPDDAAALVHRALENETNSASGERDALLARARQLDPDSSPAHWHGGYVRREDRWVHFRDVPELNAPRETLDEYQRRRAAAPDNFRGHVDLANWCREQKLPARERAHLTAALAQPEKFNEAALRARLGFELVNGRWEMRRDAHAVRNAARDRELAFRHWLPKLKRIARGLAHPRLHKSFAEQLKAIDDPAALPAMEAVFSHRDVATVLLLIEAYAGMPSHAAAEALARQAVYSPWDAVRERAAKKLQSRPPESYAPSLLAALHTPVDSRINLYIGSDGVRLSQAFFREQQEFKELATIDLATRFAPYTAITVIKAPDNARRHSGGSSARRRIGELALDAELKAHAAVRRVEMENDVTQKQNDRICTALSTATGVQLPVDAQAWWKWWLDYNELHDEGEKPCRYYCRKAQAIEPLPYSIRIYDGPVSCLAAGTLVWTDRGSVPVEKIQVGDLALSKDPVTGELAYKPVLRTTVRPAKQLLMVQTGRGEFHSTGGHTFWISGYGWQKIRDARTGMRFHGAAGPVELTHPIEPGREEPTYNLIVADFHTYFVSESMLLSHDPTFAQPTDMVVPGLAATYDGGRSEE